MPSPSLTTAQALEVLARLYAEVDGETAQLSARHGERLKCRNGCNACCVDGITVFAVEAENIRRHHPELLTDGSPHPEGKCAFLNDAGSCRIYAHRPYVCRTQGLPLRWHIEQPDGHPVEYRDICPLNEAGEPIESLPEEACWAIGPVEGRLAQLQASLDGGELQRVPLRSLFAGCHEDVPR